MQPVSLSAQAEVKLTQRVLEGNLAWVEIPQTKTISDAMDKLVRTGNASSTDETDTCTNCTPVHYSTLYCPSDDGLDCLGSLKLLLRSGAKINLRNWLGLNALQFLLSREISGVRVDLRRFLSAAGEATKEGVTAEDDLAIPDEKLELKHLCRVKIRQHLLSVDPQTNLFVAVPLLGLPPLMNSFLLYNMSVDDDIAENSNGDSSIVDSSKETGGGQ